MKNKESTNEADYVTTFQSRSGTGAYLKNSDTFLEDSMGLYNSVTYSGDYLIMNCVRGMIVKYKSKVQGNLRNK